MYSKATASVDGTASVIGLIVDNLLCKWNLAVIYDNLGISRQANEIQPVSCDSPAPQGA
jgi:hypothetical protein